MDKITVQEVNRVLPQVMHPEIGFNLVDLGMVENVVCGEDQIELTRKLLSLHVPIRDLLIRNTKETLARLDKSKQVKINVEQMTQQERDRFMKMAKEGWKL
jgi:metal-sulfur cluster biosynthetic enzyme